MRVYIQHEGSFYSIYRVTATESKVVGLSGPIGVFSALKPGVKEVHFTYPKDGDLHYTYIFDGEQKIREFHNRIVYLPENDVETRTDKNFINTLLPFYKQQSLNSPELFFQLPALSIPIHDKSFWFKKSSTRPNLDNDIVVSSSDYSELSIGVFLIGNSQEANPANMWATPGHRFVEQRTNSFNPKILMLVSGKDFTRC